MTTTPAGRPEPEQAMLKALEDIAPAGPWGSRSRSTIEVLESEDWARVTINVNANKLIGPKVKRYLLAVAPANARALVERTASLRAENERLRDVLHLNGFVRCDIAACNCGSWHARFGLRERFDEIKEDLADAGHPLTNDNGNMPRNALRELIAERDAQARRIAELEARDAETVALITECRAAFAEELAAYDISPPIHHLDQCFDKCVAWLKRRLPAPDASSKEIQP